MERRITRRTFVAGAAGAAGAFCLPRTSRAQSQAGDSAVSEIIRVAEDGWHFETAASQQRFIPFGANLVLTSKEDLNIFGPRYTGERYERILEACAGLHLNVLKVFLPIAQILPDPQDPAEIRIADGYLGNLDDFLDRAARHGIRAVVTLSEWGGSTLDWWNEGGQYFGRSPWKTDEGPDSIGMIRQFWRLLGERLQGHPAVFSYSTCVEWSMPNGNLTGPWQAEPDDIGLVPGETALWHWRRFAMSKYGSLSDINDAWDTAYASVDEIPVVDYRYDADEKRYYSSDAMVLDYSNFREWATMRYFVPQIEAIREADPTHMVTISNHMRSWNLWEGAARHFLGFTPAEQVPYVDYLTHHGNYDTEMFNDENPRVNAARETEVMTRLACGGGVKPVIVEEFTFASDRQDETADMQEAMVLQSVGAASGWMTWYLQYPDDANAADAKNESAWFDRDFNPTPWGVRAKALYERLTGMETARKAAAREVALDRKTSLVPRETSPIVLAFTEYDAHPQPTDFRMEREPDVHLAVQREVPGEGALKCLPVISGCLRPLDLSFHREHGIEGWRREMDDERRIGFDLLWISHLRPGLDEPNDDVVGTILDVCAERNMQVILDTGSTPSWYGHLDVRREVEETGKTIDEIAERYRDHPAFHAWYVPHEIYVAYGKQAAFIDEVYPALVDRCKAAADKPVTLSPFFILDRNQIFGEFQFPEPEEYEAYWTRLIARSKFDVIMLQDSGEHFSWCTNAMRFPWFEAMQRACAASGATLWGNVETAEYVYPSIEEFEREYGRTHHSTVGLPWRAVPIPRLEAKLRLAAAYSERIVSWGCYQFGRPHLSDEAAAWYEGYRAYQERVRREA